VPPLIFSLTADQNEFSGFGPCALRLHMPYSNSEQDMKYPQRGQTILQWFDSRRLPHTGQNWLGNSSAASRSSFFRSARATTAS